MTSLKHDMKDELTTLCRCDTLKVPKKPFKVYDRLELEAKYGADWEAGIAEEINEPVWVTNIPREFYDFEDFKTGKWDNYDLFLPTIRRSALRRQTRMGIQENPKENRTRPRSKKKTTR